MLWKVCYVGPLVSEKKSSSTMKEELDEVVELGLSDKCQRGMEDAEGNERCRGEWKMQRGMKKSRWGMEEERGLKEQQHPG